MFHEGQQLGEYTLVEKLGRGGFGEVWLAENDDELFAVKLPHKDQVDWKSITQEIGLWTLCGKHPNVMPLVGARNFNGQIAIISEYAPDGSLEDLLREKVKLSVEEAIEMTIGILEGLQHLHESGIIHRDLKPANILLDGKTPRLTDFGISRIISADSLSETIAGTWAYMAPECFDGKRNIQTDIWAVGIILYRMLTGKLPFPQKEQTSLIGAIILQEPELLPDAIPFEIHKIIAKILDKKVSERYQTIKQTIDDLRSIFFQTDFIPSLSVFLQIDSEFEEIENNYSRETSIKQILIPYRKGYRWGFCDTGKNIFIDPIYDEVEVFHEDMAKIQKGNFQGFVDRSGNELILSYNTFYNFSEDLLAVRHNSKCGFVNKYGEEIIPLIYDGVLNFAEGLAGVKVCDKCGYIDKKGILKVPLKYQELWLHSEGLARVKYESKWGFINQVGEEIIEIKYEDAWGFSEDRCIVHLNGRRGFIDKNGYETILPYDYIGHFSEGLAAASFNNKCGFIDKTGKQVIPLKYDTYLDFSEGLALVTLEGKHGFINYYGSEVVPMIYDNADSFSENLALVMFDGNLFEKQGFINSKGQVIIPLKYDDAKGFSEGLACVKYGNKWGFVDNEGNEIISLKYEYAESFKNGIALVKLKGRKGYIGKDGTEYFED